MDQQQELDDIRSASERIAGKLHRTPLMSSPSLGAGVSFKCEMFQRTGSFKIRGVLNKLLRLSQEERARGVVGVSSGNHAQALAYGAGLLGIESTIVMPAGAVASKVAATRGYGGRVRFTEGDLLEAFESVRDEHGLTPVHPFNDIDIIAGAGTAGLEILEDAPDADFVFVPIGGGGLASGLATAVKLVNPAARVIGVEPEGSAVVSRSLTAGRLVRLDRSETIADGLMPPFTGELTFDRIGRYVDEVILVSDQQIVEAMRAVIENLKVVAEPSGAASYAGLRSGKIKLPEGAKTVCVLSGGNIDAARLKEFL